MNLYTNNCNDVNMMVSQGYKYALTACYADDTNLVISRHKTYDNAHTSAGENESIVDLVDIKKTFELENS